ncbi:hypothetical protein C0J52_22132 [Blattella germanica]|nr:hypothetical protein C0J52_22132 [Blattella germanica]
MEENIKTISEILADLKKGQDRMSGEMTKMSAAMDRRITLVENIVKDEYVLGRTSRLRNSNIRIDQDYDFNTRNIRKQLLPFLKKTRSEGQRASLVKDKIRINGKIYDLEHCTKLFEKPSTEERNNYNSLSPRQERRSFRSTSAEGRKNTEENSRVSITQRRSRSKSPIREQQPWSLQTSPRYNAACASQTEDNENTGKESNYRKTRQHKDKSQKVDHRDDGSQSVVGGSALSSQFYVLIKILVHSWELEDEIKKRTQHGHNIETNSQKEREKYGFKEVKDSLYPIAVR